MKIVLTLLFCLVLGWAPAAPAAQKNVVASVFPVWLLLRQVTQNVPDMNAQLLLPAGTGCPHDYAMTPQDRRTLARADVLVINGLGLESFLGSPEKTRELMKPGALLIDLSRGMDDLIEEEGHEGHGANPHIFASPTMMAKMALSLAGQLAGADKDNAALYAENGRRAAEAYAALAEACAAAGSRLAGKGVVTQHDIFGYLVRDMGLSVDGLIQPHEGQEPSARDMLDLVRLIREKGTAAVITEPQYPARAGQTLAAETGVPCIELDPVASGPADAPLDYYETVMRDNLRTLEKNLER